VYERYGVTENPFPQNPTIVIDSSDKRVNGSIFYEGLFLAELQKFEKLLQNRTNVIYVRGTQLVRGDGKSAMMAHQFHKYAGNQNIVTAFLRCTDKNGNISEPREYCKELIRHFHTKNYLWTAFGRLFTKFIAENPKYNHAEQGVKLLFQKYTEPPEIVPITRFTRIVRINDLALAFADWLTSTTGSDKSVTTKLAESYLTEPMAFLTKLARKSDKVSDYGSYLKLLMAADYEWCYFFLDQMEDSISVASKKEIVEFTSGFRRMIEASSNCSTIVGTLHPSSLRNLMDNPDAGVNIKSFAPPDENHCIGLYPDEVTKNGRIVDLLTLYFSHYKNTELDNTSQQILPFEPIVMKYIAHIYKGNLRDILRTIHQLLKLAAEKNLDNIDEKFILDNHHEAIGKEFSQEVYNQFINGNN